MDVLAEAFLCLRNQRRTGSAVPQILWMPEVREGEGSWDLLFPLLQPPQPTAMASLIPEIQLDCLHCPQSPPLTHSPSPKRPNREERSQGRVSDEAGPPGKSAPGQLQGSQVWVTLQGERAPEFLRASPACHLLLLPWEESPIAEPGTPERRS